jgi:hypothetical protein
MPMPTTRRGRFLYYKARAVKRNKLARNRGAYVSPPGGSDANRVTARGLDHSMWEKQAPKSHPVEPTNYTKGLLPDSAWVVKPAKGRFGVLKHWDLTPPWWGPKTRPTYGSQGYFERRVRSIPSQSLWTYLPYLLPKSALRKGDVYPFATYPSGRPSFAASKGWV